MMYVLRNMEFANPWWFLLLLAVPLFLYGAYAQSSSNFALGFPSINADLFKARNWKKWLLLAMPILKVLGFSFLVMAMARPQLKFQKQKISSEGIDIVIAVDLSLSMLAKDFEPDRLTVAKRVISDFIEDRPSDRIGLSVFAGESYTASPPTLDHRVLQEFISDLTYGQLKDGTAIGMGISTSINRLKDSKAKSKIIILVTDGSNNAGDVDPLDAADMASTLGIKVYTIGVGTNGQALMPSFFNGKTNYRYFDVVIDEVLLNEIAMKTGGSYFRATNEQELENIYDMINQLEKSEFDSTTLTRREDKFVGFLGIGLILLLIDLLMRMSLFRNILKV